VAAAAGRAPRTAASSIFGSKKELAGTLFLEVLQRHQAAVLAVLDASTDAEEGIARLIHAHLDWVVNSPARTSFSLRDLAQWMK
jgi:hypothetical protein